MSRFDRSETDHSAHFEDRPMDASEFPREGESWAQASQRAKDEEALATDVRVIRRSLDSIRIAIAKVSTMDMAFRVCEETRRLDFLMDAIHSAAADKLNDMGSL